MKVRLQLLRDDGTVIIELHGLAHHTLEWEGFTPVVNEDPDDPYRLTGVRCTAVQYTAQVHREPHDGEET